MKTLILSLALSAAAASIASAEVRETVQIHFNQPIAAGASTLPAGNYRFSVVHSQVSLPTLLVQNLDTHESVFVAVARVESSNASGAARTEVVLRNNGGKHSLGTLWFQGELLGYSAIAE